MTTTRRIKDTVCPEGKKMTKTGAKCIEDKSYVFPGQRRTVCLEGYRISKDGKCIKDKNYVVKMSVSRSSPSSSPRNLTATHFGKKGKKSKKY